MWIKGRGGVVAGTETTALYNTTERPDRNNFSIHLDGTNVFKGSTFCYVDLRNCAALNLSTDSVGHDAGVSNFTRSSEMASRG